MSAFTPVVLILLAILTCFVQRIYPRVKVTFYLVAPPPRCLHNTVTGCVKYLTCVMFSGVVVDVLRVLIGVPWVGYTPPSPCHRRSAFHPSLILLCQSVLRSAGAEFVVLGALPFPTNDEALLVSLSSPTLSAFLAQIGWDLGGSCLQSDLLGPGNAQSAEVSTLYVIRTARASFASRHDHARIYSSRVSPWNGKLSSS